MGNERLLLGNERLLLGIIGVFGIFGISFFFVAGGFWDAVGRGARRGFRKYLRNRAKRIFLTMVADGKTAASWEEGKKNCQKLTLSWRCPEYG